MLSDNKRLFDLSTRIALYIEAVKVQQSREFNEVLYELSEIFKKLLAKVQYSTLDGLSKAQLNKLVLALRKSQYEVYSRYTEKLLKQLEDFTAVVLQVNRQVYASNLLNDFEEDEEIKVLSDEDAIIFIEDENEQNGFIALFGLAAALGSNNGVYKTGLSTPLAANGYYPIPFIKNFSAASQVQTENVIRMAWANRLTPNETLTELIGNPSQPVGLASQISRIRNQATAVIHTTMGHFSNMASAAVQSALFGRYMWVSVMDSATTEICTSRNRKVYTYGQGPIPPAHIRCRSHITPFSILNSDEGERF